MEQELNESLLAMNIVIQGRKFTFLDGTVKFGLDYLNIDGFLISVDDVPCAQDEKEAYMQEMEGYLRGLGQNRAFSQTVLHQASLPLPSSLRSRLLKVGALVVVLSLLGLLGRAINVL